MTALIRPNGNKQTINIEFEIVVRIIATTSHNKGKLMPV